jgi:hypothetical protein
MPTDLERILGLGPFDERRPIPGTVPVGGREFLYVLDDGTDDFSALFEKLTAGSTGHRATTGGAITENCRLFLPDGRLFHALSYKGDLEGWRKDIEEAVDTLGLQVAAISIDRLVLSDGHSVALSDCRTEFY